MSVRGDLPGLSQTLLHTLRSYEPGADGLFGISTCVVTLDVPDWAAWSWLEQGDSASQDAGSTTAVTIYTVPEDERAWLEHIFLARASGDNEVANVGLVYPTGYFVGISGLSIAALATPGATLIWPDPSDVQTLTRWRPGPVLLEPGTAITLGPSGAGVSATVFTHYISMRRTKFIRAQVP